MVFLFVPNIIGYFRFAFLFAILFTYRQCPYFTVFFYAISQILDAFDGIAARKYNQCTRFGSVLDMVCDRASNAVLLAILAGLFPRYSWIFLADIILDLVSHWYQMYSSLVIGSHHKNAASKYTLLNIYYTSKPVLFTLVFGNQLFLLTTYFIAFYDNMGWSESAQNLNYIGFIIGAILFAIKKLMSVIQLVSACQMIAEVDIQDALQAKKKEN